MLSLKLDVWFIAAIIRTRRIDLKLTQPEVARAVRMTSDTIRNWETGRTRVPYLAVAKLASVLKLDAETAAFMEQIIDDRDGKNVQANPRLNALILAMAERHYGQIWKWDPELMPGPLQTRAYQFGILKPTEELTDQQAQFGWNFKRGRQEQLERRALGYRINIIIGNSVFFHLRNLAKSERAEQVEYVRECAARPGWDIRVMDRYHTLGEAFDVYLSEGNETAGPAFVYTQIHDVSWCIEEKERVGLYYERVRKNHPRAIPLEEFLDAERDRLA